jgi:putative transposase
MLSTDDWETYSDHLNLSEEAKDVLNCTRTSDPVRRLRSHSGKPSDQYTSHKMGHTIQSKGPSTTALLYELEHDDDVLEIWDQPFEIDLEYPGKSGKLAQAIGFVPDFVVIRKNAIVVYESFTEKELCKRSEQMPERYVRDDDDRWRCPPGESWAHRYGFTYQVRSSSETNVTLQRNILHLEDFYRASCPPVPPQVAIPILKHVEAEPGIRLDELLERTQEIATIDHILILIAYEKVYVELTVDPLPEIERVRCFPDEATARANIIITTQLQQSKNQHPRPLKIEVGTIVIWDGQPCLIVNRGDTTISFLRDDKTAIDLPLPVFDSYLQQGKIKGGKTEAEPTELSAEAQAIRAHASRADFEEANRRYWIIKPDLDDREPTEEERAAYEATPPRTRREWKKNFRVAEEKYQVGYLGLLPQHSRKGRYGDRLGDRRTLMNEAIESDYEVNNQPTAKSAYRVFKADCRKKDIDPPSYKAFTKALKERPRYDQTLKRQGRRAAYQQKDLSHSSDPSVPRHGDRPWNCAHLDHFELDLELRCVRTKKNLGKAWLTLLIDAYTRRVLAIWISFDPPSYRSCMMVMRICVQKWQRLPQILVVDGGKEFRSVYFETFLARYGVTKRTRPPAEPRYGAPLERIFETTNEQLIHNLIANTKIMKNVRQVTKDVNPRNLAVWTVDRTYIALSEYFYEVYDQNVHSSLGESPREAYELGIIQSGLRIHVRIPYNEDFIMMTRPTTSKGTALVQPGRGVKIRYLYYWSDAFKDRTVERTQVEIRYEPLNIGIAYAFVKGQWHECISDKYSVFQGRSEREIMIASREFHKLHQMTGDDVELSEQRLAEFIGKLEKEEVIMLQRLRDDAALDILSNIDGLSSLTRIKTIQSPEESLNDKKDNINQENELFEDIQLDEDDIYGDF